MQTDKRKLNVRKQLPGTVILLFGLAILNTVAYSQETASIVGTVTDPTGSAIPNAKVTITQTETGLVHSTVTNATGNYAATELPIGHYNVRVEAAGFKAYEQQGITLEVNGTVRANAILDIGTTQESVTVEANAVEVQADTNEVSETITPTFLSELQTDGRNVIQLAALVAGASSGLPGFDSPMAQNQSHDIVFNGQRSDHNDWLINGGEAYDRGSGGILLVSPSQDSLQEFKVLTSNYAADLGQASGGMIVMATKSGTKQFHASAWEYVRNNAFDANTFFSNLNGQPQPELRYNAFGFNVGGPIPKIGHEKKTFFFYNMEWRRLIQGSVINATSVPVAARGGDFSYLSTPITVPETSDPAAIAKFAQYGLTPGEQFPGNKIPSGLLDPNAVTLLSAGLFPAANAANNLYYASANQPTNYREETFRIDHQVGNKLALYASLLYDNGTETSIPPLWAGGTYATAGSVMAVPSWAGVIHATTTISPNLLNEAAFNFNGNDLTITDFGLWQKPSGYTVPNLFPSDNPSKKLPGISINAPYYISYTPGWWPWYNTWRSWQGKDDLTWVHGKHNFKFGASWMYTHKWQQYQLNAGGQFTFSGAATGNAFADFLLGFASSYSEPANVNFVRISTNNYNLYAMDDWRVNNRLTLNLGLRWEIIPHAYDTENNASDFYPNLYNPANAAQFLPSGALNTSGPGFTTVSGIPTSNIPFYLNGIGLAGRNGIPAGLVDNHWDTFAPRVGFAFDLTGHQKTILRGGFGMFYERLAGNEMYNLIQNSVPFAYTANPSNVYLDNPATQWTNGVTASTPYFPASIWGLANPYRVPTAAQWSLGIQHQLSQNAVLTATYVGNSDYNQAVGQNINYLPQDSPDRLGVCGNPCGYTGTPLNVNLYRPYQGWGSITELETQGNSNYESLQISLKATAWKQLTILSNYTWSHAFDVEDGELFTALDNPYNRLWDYGPAGWDRRQIFINSFVYPLPFFRASTARAARALLGGWQLSGVFTLESGQPVSIGSEFDNIGSGGETNRANIVGPVTYPKTRFEWFNPASFAEPAPLQWGTASRNDIVGPGTNNWNLAMYKTFQFSERVKFEFRGETFNTFNHTQWTGLQTTVGSANFGQLTGTQPQRIFELGAKLLF